MLTPKNELDLINSTEYNTVIGIDEVGRGCWAGPVAVGFFTVTKETIALDGINDSKKISQKKREQLHRNLSSSGAGVYYASPKIIDSMGIAQAIQNLIIEIINKHNSADTYFLIDGQFSTDFGLNSKKVLKGDSIYYSIAAASILAKVERDRKMAGYDIQYPGYAFAQHKGYGTKIHMESLERLGPCHIHRKSYKPVAKYL